MKPMARLAFAVLALVGLCAAAFGAISAQAPVVQTQRFTIQQNGVTLGTVDVPSTVRVSVGTIYSGPGQPNNDVLLRMGTVEAPIVLHIPGASVTMSPLTAGDSR